MVGQIEILVWVKARLTIAPVLCGASILLRLILPDGGMSEAKPVLTRGDAIGYHGERMFYRFTMMRGRTPVSCEMSNGALMDLAGRTSIVVIDHEAVFPKHRDLIEAVACGLFRRNEYIRNFSKHLLRPVKRTFDASAT